MTKLLTVAFAVTLAFGLNTSIAQNVKSDKDQAQGQEQKMQEKEKGTTGGQQTGTGDRERIKTEDTRSAPTANECKGMTGHAKEECIKGQANRVPADSGTAQQGQKPKQQ